MSALMGKMNSSWDPWVLLLQSGAMKPGGGVRDAKKREERHGGTGVRGVRVFEGRGEAVNTRGVRRYQAKEEARSELK